MARQVWRSHMLGGTSSLQLQRGAALFREMSKLEDWVSLLSPSGPLSKPFCSFHAVDFLESKIIESDLD